MRKIAIVGGGQSGLQLALGLLKNNYEVTVVSDRTAEQIFNGRVTSSQFMFHDSLQNERDLGINCWERECPLTEGLAFTIPGPHKTKALFWEAKLDHHGQSVDQRVKFAAWMNEFAKRGGDLAIKNAGPADIDEYSKTHDLVIVAASAKGIVEQAVRCSRPGAKILLFAQTSHQERVDLSGADICMGERTLCGSYSASIDVQSEGAEMVFKGPLNVERLISHRYTLNHINEGIDRALHPDEESLKIVVQPQRWKE